MSDFPPEPPERDVDAPGEQAAPGEQLQPPTPLPSPQDSPAEGETPGLSAETPVNAPGPAHPSPGPELFTSGEKIGSLVDLVLNTPPPDARTRSAVAAIKTAQRFRLLRPILDGFPPLDDAQAWDEWIATAVGVALNLVSDGVDVDVDELERQGALILGQLFAAAEGGTAGA